MTGRNVPAMALVQLLTIASALWLAVPSEAQEYEGFTINGPLRVGASFLPLPTVPDGAFGWREAPIGAVLPSGASCIAWLDSRQGGLLMAARISTSGALLDPMGIPLARGHYVRPAAVTASSAGCTVAFQESPWGNADLIGLDLSWTDPVGVPRERFRIPGVSGSFHYAHEDVLMIFSRVGSATVVEAIESDGTIRSGSTPVVVTVRSVTTLGGTHYLAGSSLAGKPSIWRLEPDLTLARVPTETIPENSVLRLFPDGSGGLLLTATRGTHLEVLRYGLDGKILEWRDRPTPGPVLGVIEEGTTRFLLLQHASDAGTMILDLETLAPAATVPAKLVYMQERNGVRLFVYGPPETFHSAPRFELGRTLPSGSGALITATPDPEVLVDVAKEGDAVALLWGEFRGGEMTLNLGLTRGDPLGQLTPIAVGPVDHYRAAAVAIRNGITMVLWVRDDMLWYRQLDRDGLWIDQGPRLLSSRRLAVRQGPKLYGIGPGSLIATEAGFVVVWGEVETKRLRQATITSSGDPTERDLPFEPTRYFGEDIIPVNVAVSRWESGFVVAAMHAFPPECNFTCLPSPHLVVVMRYDEAWTGGESLVPEEPERPGTYWGLDLVEGDGELLLLTDDRGTIFRSDDSGATEITTIQTELDDATALWLDGRYVLVGHRWGSSSTRARIHDPRGRLTSAWDLVPDLAMEGSLTYQPRLVSIGHRLWLFGSEVSADPTEGAVRRLRIHEVESGPPHERRRTIRR
jgi:hypothetical protein